MVMAKNARYNLSRKMEKHDFRPNSYIKVSRDEILGQMITTWPEREKQKT